MKILRVENKNEEGKRRNENQFTRDNSASTSLPGMKSHARVIIFVCFAAAVVVIISAFSTFSVSLVLMATVAG